MIIGKASQGTGHSSSPVQGLGSASVQTNIFKGHLNMIFFIVFSERVYQIMYHSAKGIFLNLITMIIIFVSKFLRGSLNHSHRHLGFHNPAGDSPALETFNTETNLNV